MSETKWHPLLAAGKQAQAGIAGHARTRTNTNVEPRFTMQENATSVMHFARGLELGNSTTFFTKPPVQRSAALALPEKSKGAFPLSHSRESFLEQQSGWRIDTKWFRRGFGQTRFDFAEFPLPYSFLPSFRMP
jgi:hypothetical protein